jgi:hypothetical protein
MLELVTTTAEHNEVALIERTRATHALFINVVHDENNPLATPTPLTTMPRTLQRLRSRLVPLAAVVAAQHSSVGPGSRIGDSRNRPRRRATLPRRGTGRP